MLKSFFEANLEKLSLISPLFGTYHIIGLAISFSFISSLFIFKKTYAKLSQTNYLNYTLGTIQISMYIGYFLVHGLNNPDFNWTNYFPFQLCSVLNLTTAFLLFFPNKKVFNLSFLYFAPVALAFLVPDQQKFYYGPQNFLYYNFYIIHTLIIFTYLYLYLYGQIQYDKKSLIKSLNCFVMFGFIVFIFNESFGTNYLFIGREGYQVNLGNLKLDTSTWLPLYRFSFMLMIGLIFTFVNYLIFVFWAKPFYKQHENKKTKLSLLYCKIKLRLQAKFNKNNNRKLWFKK